MVVVASVIFSCSRCFRLPGLADAAKDVDDDDSEDEEEEVVVVVVAMVVEDEFDTLTFAVAQSSRHCFNNSTISVSEISCTAIRISCTTCHCPRARTVWRRPGTVRADTECEHTNTRRGSR